MPVNSRPAIAKVIDNRFCIGCGACTAAHPAFKVIDTQNGEKRVVDVPADPVAIERGSRVCPFGDSPDERELADLFLTSAPNYSDGLGRYIHLYAGWSNAHRGTGGSGGLTRWLLAKLLDTGEVDYIVQVNRKLQQGAGSEDLFSYAIHANARDFLQNTSTSAYHPVSLQEVLAEIESRPGRCIVTALPCFARGIRALILEKPHLGQKIRFISGVICGSLKSKRYAEYLSAQLGVEAEELDRINFRGKSLSRSAREKCVEVWKQNDFDDQPRAAAVVQELKGTHYGQGYFKPKACDYCDDVMAETADIAFGDAWVAPYADDPAGANIVIIRNAQLSAIFSDAMASREVTLDALPPEAVIASQASALRHRRKGLRVRLWLAHLAGFWTPRKRVTPALAHPVAVSVQISRMLIRRITSADGISPGSRMFRVLMALALKCDRAADILQRRTRGQQTTTEEGRITPIG